MTKRYNQKEIVKLVAERAGFTIGDVNIILNTFIDIFTEIIGRKETVIIRNLFRMYLTKKSQKRTYNLQTKEMEEYPDSYYVSFKASPMLLSKLPEMEGRVPEEKYDEE